MNRDFDADLGQAGFAGRDSDTDAVNDFLVERAQNALLVKGFRQVCPVKYAQTCSSGQCGAAHRLAAAGIGPGDEVITTPITDLGTVIGIRFQQAVPVFADQQPNNCNPNLADIERKTTPKTKVARYQAV